MTPTQQLGYSDQKAGTLDPDLSRADTPKGREYRDGMRAARRDAVDGVIAANEGKSPPETAYETACMAGGHGEREGTPILDMKLAEMRPAGQLSPIDQAINAANVIDLIDKAIIDAGPAGVCAAPAPAIIPPVYDKKKTRKAKPVDEGQGTFL